MCPAAVNDVRERLAQTRWPDEIPGSAWEYGANLNFIRDVCHYWRTQFDWRAQVEALSAWHHYSAVIDGIRIHFIHERGRGPSPVPLILTHAWPRSFVDFLRIIPLLTDPASHGGDSSDAFDVVVPSFPDFGFSDRPAIRGMNAFRVAELWAELMSGLGYDRFAGQGGHLGAGASTALGLRHSDRIIALHLNFIPGSYRPFLPESSPPTQEEAEFIRVLASGQRTTARRAFRSHGTARATR